MRNAEITVVMWPEPDEELYGRLFTAVADAAYDFAPDGYEVDVSARMVDLGDTPGDTEQ